MAFLPSVCRVMGIGMSSPSRVDITVGGQKLKRGIKLWPVGVSILKSELFQLLNVLKEEEKVPAGYCHFPEYAPEYFKQLTAEQLVSKVVKDTPNRSGRR